MRHVAMLSAMGLLTLTASALETENGKVRHAKDWPNWRGPYCSGSASPCGEEVVDSSSDAKLAWRSEERKLPTSYWTASGWIEASGFGDLAIVDGRVYMYYYRRAGNIISRKRYDQIYAHWDTEERRRYWSSLDTDDIVICMDARTGRTLWKTFFWGKGLNYRDMAAGFGPLTSPCIADGRAYTLGSSGRVYCLDAKSGRPIWESDLGSEFVIVDYMLRKAERRQPNGFLDSCPIYADGVVACNDHSKGKREKEERAGLIGFDGKTGRKLWVIADCIHGGPGVSPVRWTHKGKEYFIAVHRERAVCIEPRTGKILWEIKGQLHQGGTPAVCEDYLILGGTTNTHGEYKVLPDTTGMSCYRITPEGAKLVWRLSPLNYAKGNQTSPLILDGHVYVGIVGVMGHKGGFTCIELESGLVRGSVDLGAGYTPVACDGRVFTTTGVMMHAMPDLARNLSAPRFGKPEPYSHATYTACAVADGRLYVRGRDSVYCYDLRKSASTRTNKPAIPADDVDPSVAHIPPWMRGRQATTNAAPAKVEEEKPKPPPLPSDVPGLVNELRDRHLVRREQASFEILKLATTGNFDSVAGLTELALSDDWPTQTAAVGVLELMGAAARPATARLRTALLTALDAKRRSDVELLIPTLMRIDADSLEAAVPEFAARLAHEDADVAFLACAALEATGPRAAAAVPALTKLLDGDDARLAAAAARALERIGPGADTVPALGRCLKSDDSTLVMRALRALCAAGFAARAALPDAVSVIDKLLADPELLAVCTRDMFNNIGPGAAAVLIEQIKKAGTNEQIAGAIRALALLGTDACDAVPLLETIVKDRDNVNRRLAEETLKKISVTE